MVALKAWQGQARMQTSPQAADGNQHLQEGLTAAW